MERELFNWESWNDSGHEEASFHDVTLRKQIGEYPVGTKFPLAIIAAEGILGRGVLQLFDDKGLVAQFSIGYEIRGQDFPRK